MNLHFDHKTSKLQPNHRALHQQPFVNDVLPDRILAGAIQIRGNVSHFEKDSVEFEDGTRVPIDDVILATGYTRKYDFLPPEISSSITDGRVELYKFIFPVGHANVAFVGLVDPVGAFWPVAEMQARYVSRVFSGNLVLPDVSRQAKEAKRRASFRTVNSDRYATQVGSNLDRDIDFVPTSSILSLRIRTNIVRRPVSGCPLSSTGILFTTWLYIREIRRTFECSS